MTRIFSLKFQLPSLLRIQVCTSQFTVTFMRYGGLLGSSSGFEVCLASPQLRMLLACPALDLQVAFSDAGA